MDDTPPRRSRRPNDKRKNATFPLIPFLIGVVVLGFVIGAGLSMAGRHGGKQVASVPVATLEPTALPAATLAPLSTPRPTPSVTEASETESSAPDSPTPAATVAAKPSLKPSAKPSAHVALASLPPSSEPTAASSAEPAPSAVATPAPVHTHAAPLRTTAALPAMKTAVPAATPAVSATPAVAASAAATPEAAVAVVEADSDFGRLCANVVRQYLRALERGDTESAAGAFAPGSSTAYPERAVLDSSAQIGTISAHGSSDTQTVNVTISTSAGTYFATYAVHRSSTGAAIIVSHSLNKG